MEPHFVRVSAGGQRYLFVRGQQRVGSTCSPRPRVPPPLCTNNNLRSTLHSYNTNPALLIALLIRAGWRGVAGDDARDDGRDDARAAVISARRRRVSSSRQSAASAFDRSSAISEISYRDFRQAIQALRMGP